jgi:hypothetical protein
VFEAILEIIASKSPKSRNDGDWDNDVDESDPLLNLDDNKFMNPPVGGEDEGDDASSTDYYGD